MRNRRSVTVLTTVAATVAGLLAGALTAAAPAHASLVDDVYDLPIADEDRAGYDRDLFGSYDRQDVLDANQRRWPGCAGYYSHADDQCHASSGDVHADHMVSLGEAWDSGAHSWSHAQRDAFSSDLANLWLMTGGLNLSKSDDDIAEWQPPYDPAVCPYVDRYVQVKRSWNLTVDYSEWSTLLGLAYDCS